LPSFSSEDRTIPVQKVEPIYMETPPLDDEEQETPSQEVSGPQSPSPVSAVSPVVLVTSQERSTSSLNPIYDTQPRTKVVSSTTFSHPRLHSLSSEETIEAPIVDNLSSLKDPEEDGITPVIIEANDISSPSSSQENELLTTEQQDKKKTEQSVVDDEDDESSPSSSILETQAKTATKEKIRKSSSSDPIYDVDQTPRFVQAMEMEDNIVKPSQKNPANGANQEKPEKDETLVLDQTAGVPDWAIKNFVSPDFVD